MSGSAVASTGASIVRHHHERLDRSGCPDGLKGDAIPLLDEVQNGWRRKDVVDAFIALNWKATPQ